MQGMILKGPAGALGGQQRPLAASRPLTGVSPTIHARTPGLQRGTSCCWPSSIEPLSIPAWLVWTSPLRVWCAGRSVRLGGTVCQTGKKLSALEILRQENELLRKTLEQNGVVDDQPAAPAVAVEGADADGTSWPDYWTPAFEVPVEDVEFEDEYGAISPIPNHDGTECFKWDNTLWAAADHFKVGDHAGLTGNPAACWT